MIKSGRCQPPNLCWSWQDARGGKWQDARGGKWQAVWAKKEHKYIYLGIVFSGRIYTFAAWKKGKPRARNVNCRYSTNYIQQQFLIIFINTNKVMMKRIYTAPIVLVEDVMVESGIAASGVLYGKEGEAGAEGSYGFYEGDDL